MFLMMDTRVGANTSEHSKTISLKKQAFPKEGVKLLVNKYRNVLSTAATPRERYTRICAQKQLKG